MRRDEVSISNAILCRPKEKMTREEWNRALEACRPRVSAELGRGQARYALTLGGKALQTLTGKGDITNWMGGPLVLSDGSTTIIPSIHPAFALRRPAYIPVFKTMVARAVNRDTHWDWGRLVTKPPYLPALEELMHEEEISVDIENSPLTGKIRCIGVGSASLAVSVPIPPEGQASEEDLDALRRLLASPATKILQNGQHDRGELKKHGYDIRGTYFDLLLAHAVVAPRLAHDLGFMAAVEFPAPRWKSEHRISGDDKGGRGGWFTRASIDDLLLYNCKDNIMQARLAPRLRGRTDTVHNGAALFDEYQQLDEITFKMKETGIAVDTSRFQGHRERLHAELDDINKRFRTIVTSEDYQLGKNAQNQSLNNLFFVKLKVPAVSFSEETCNPSLDNGALQSYIKRYSEAGGQRIIADIARIIYEYRKTAKLLGSYIDNLPVGVDGRVHPSWRVFGARTGRWSATHPAIQTIPQSRYGRAGLRDIFCASPGMTLVKGDYKQLEVRIVAFLSGDKLFLEWFANGDDPYKLTAQEVFGQSWQLADERRKKDLRQLTKAVVLGKNYGGGARTLWGNLVVQIPNLRLEAVEYVLRRIDELHPQVKEWQDHVIRTAQTQGYVEAPLSGRRQYYQDGKIIPTEVLNFPIQATAGDLANRSVLRLVSRNRWPLAQVHDELLCEGSDARGVATDIKWAMEQSITLNGATMTFPVELAAGPNWQDMKEIKV